MNKETESHISYHNLGENSRLMSLLDMMAQEVERANIFDGFLIHLVNEKRKALECVCIKMPTKFKEMAANYARLRYGFSEKDINILSCQHNKAILVQRSEAHTFGLEFRFERWEMESLLVLPLAKGKNAVGSLMGFTKLKRLNQDSFHLQEKISRFITPIKEIVEQELSLQKEQEDDLTIPKFGNYLDVSIKINSLSDLDSIYTIITQELLATYEFDLASILMLEEQKLVVKKHTVREDKHCEILKVWDGYYSRKPYELDPKDGATSLAFLKNTHFFFPSLQDIKHLPMSQKDRNALNILDEAKSFLIMPIRKKGSPVGILWLWSFEERNLAEVELKVIETLCTYIGTAIANASLYTEVESQRKKIESINRDLLHHQQELQKHKDNLELLVSERTLELNRTQEVTVDSLGTLAEYRDPETGGHIQRTKNYIKELARELSKSSKYRQALDDTTIDLLYMSAPLHDIGKVGIPDGILLKPGKLTTEEFEVMKKHAAYGRDALLRSSHKRLGDKSFLQTAIDIAGTHHERWDGTGYPEGLQGEDIPLSGRLMAIVDVYDALVSERVYKKAIPHHEAVMIIREGRGTQFAPDVVDAFLAIHETFRSILEA